MPAGWLGGVRPCKQSSPPFPPLPNESPPRTPHRSPAFVWHKGDAQPPGRALAFGEGRCPPLDPSGLGEVSFSSFLPFSLCLGTENQKTEALASKEAKAVPFAPGGRSGESSLPVLGTGARRRRGAGRTDGRTDGWMEAVKPHGNRAVTRPGASTNPDQLREQQARFGRSLLTARGRGQRHGSAQQA